MKAKDTRTTEQAAGQDSTCPTVVVKLNGVLTRINAHEHDEEKHGKAIKVEPAAPAAVAGVLPEEKKDVDFNKYTVQQLKDHLADKGAAYDTSARKDELVALCVANP